MRDSYERLAESPQTMYGIQGAKPPYGRISLAVRFELLPNKRFSGDPITGRGGPEQWPLRGSNFALYRGPKA